uniref:GTPase IMAP family member 4-like n=1 Tax=Astyanax mexicanus TaxID=7994 RepID=A0A3B1J253_ASTMX
MLLIQINSHIKIRSLLRIVLLGKRGAGKSSAGNTLLGKQPFYTAASSQRVTKDWSMSASTVDGHRISVVDTAGWTDLILMNDNTILEIAEWIDQSDPGPHVFLLVIPIGRFIKEETNTVHQILEVFGEEAHKYTMVLFTKGDDLEEMTIEDYLKDTHPDLKKIIEVCGGRYHVFNNRDKENKKQVSDLLEKIKLMAKRNEGRNYTKAMYQKTVDQIEVKWKRERIMNAARAEVEKEINDSAVGSNYETTRSKNTELKPSPDTKGTVSTKE